MGLYDELICEVELPKVGLRDREIFQTNSLFCSMGRLTITKEHRLIQHCERWEWEDSEDASTDPSRIPKMRRVPTGDRDLHFHGDLVFFVFFPEEFQGDMVARFTDGHLQWISTMEALPEIVRDVIYGSQQ